GGGGTSAQPGGARPGAKFGNPTAHDPIYVTSEYGMRMHPVLGYMRMHAGIDLRDRCGEPVYAGRDGTVQWARFRSGYGNQVMVDHGWVDGSSLMSSYNHMSSFVVGAGARVSAGQLLGYAGNTGTSAACHLHFEVYVNGSTTNPRPYLGL
ncbi:M23 family metallopeptidase, partial [Cellulomonas sp. B6]|uniref:M23 family metallopeptidase n=1 Tax=Cellulomonas sp. B6 TaxID=1295626 RepID=UPI00123775B2